MARITVTEKDYNERNLYYVQSNTAEILNSTGSRFGVSRMGSRSVLWINCPDEYKEIIASEIADKLAEVVVINYKYSFFKKNIYLYGLSECENEILMASLIAADLEEDKRYAYERFKGKDEVALDGVFNFRLQALKKKWNEIVGYVPSGFINAQLKEFISYLLENKKKKIYIEGGRVYDAHFRRLKRCELLGGDALNIVREVLLSNCGEIELTGNLPKEDEKYLKEYYGDKIIFSSRNYS